MLSVEGLRDCGAGRVLFRQVASLPRRCETQRRTNMMRNVAMLSHVCAAMGLLAHASALGAPTGRVELPSTTTRHLTSKALDLDMRLGDRDEYDPEVYGTYGSQIPGYGNDDADFDGREHEHEGPDSRPWTSAVYIYDYEHTRGAGDKDMEGKRVDKDIELQGGQSRSGAAGDKKPVKGKGDDVDDREVEAPRPAPESRSRRALSAAENDNRHDSKHEYDHDDDEIDQAPHAAPCSKANESKSKEGGIKGDAKSDDAVQAPRPAPGFPHRHHQRKLASSRLASFTQLRRELAAYNSNHSQSTDAGGNIVGVDREEKAQKAPRTQPPLEYEVMFKAGDV